MTLLRLPFLCQVNRRPPPLYSAKMDSVSTFWFKLALFFLFLRASQMLLALLAALVRGWQLRKRHRKSLVAPNKRTSCSSCGACHRQVYQLSPLKGGDGRYYCVACWKTFCDELPLCKCIAGNVQWCADCKMPATQINPVYLKDPYDANNNLQYRCKDCWFEVKADQTRFLCSNADMFQ